MLRAVLLAMACSLCGACALIGYDEAPFTLSNEAGGNARPVGTGGTPTGGGAQQGSGSTGGGSGGASTSGGSGTLDGAGTTGGGGGSPDSGGSTGGTVNPSTPCQAGASLCDGRIFVECVDGQWQQTSCEAGLSPCEQASCDATTGCGVAQAPDGLACDDNNPCTANDSCRAGSCDAGAELDCSALDSACAQGVCDPTGGSCSATPVAFGEVCGTDLICSGGECKPADALCGLQQTCNDNCLDDNCLLDCRGANACALSCEGSDCVELCQGAGTCDLQCRDSQSCALACNPAGSCTGSCENTALCDVNCDGGRCGPFDCVGSECVFHCASAQSCTNLRCLGGASCLLQCGTLPLDRCSISCVGGADTLVDCGGGNFACNRPCP